MTPEFDGSAGGGNIYERERRSGFLGRGGRRAGGADYFLPLLRRGRRENLLLILGPLVLYAVNQQIKMRVPWPAAGYLLRCYANDYLGGIAFGAYLNLILSLSRWPERQLRRPWQFLIAGVLCGLFWECAAPLVLPHSVGDPWDVAAYVLGMLTYWLLWARRLPRDV